MEPQPPNKKEGQAENHQQPDLDNKYKTTVDISHKNTARKSVFIIILCLIIGVVIGHFVGNFFNSFDKIPDAPNRQLIEYLELQRKYIDSVAVAQFTMAEEYRHSAMFRQMADSIYIIHLQQDLLKTIKKLKPQYETIPSYRHIDNDSLRRLFADRFQ